MNVVTLSGISIIFGILQLLLVKKTQRPIIKYLPIGLTIIGLLFCLVTYLGAFGTYSPSVVAENQYFALFLSIPFGAAFMGCLLGLLLSKIC